MSENWYEIEREHGMNKISDLIAISMPCMNDIKYANFLFVASFTSCISHLSKTNDKLRES
jgi:hypothetical protein